MNKVIKSGVKTKILMLSATPVNNRFADLKNQLELAYEGEAANIDDKLDTQTSIDAIFKKAQTAFNTWSTPYGMHAVVKSTPDMPAGVVFILKNISNDINIDNQNRLHPFYMVYIGEDGIPICTHLQAKKMLDMMRLVCKQNRTPNEKLCKEFNEETSEGKNMGKYSELLEEAISSIINVKDEKDDDSAFSEEESTFNKNTINGLDDFELICFLVVKDGD